MKKLIPVALAFTLFGISFRGYAATKSLKVQTTTNYCYSIEPAFSDAATLARLQIGAFNRLFVKATKTQNDETLQLRLQNATSEGFWTYSNIILSTTKLATASIQSNSLDTARSLNIFSSPNSSLLKWQQTFRIIRSGSDQFLQVFGVNKKYKLVRKQVSSCEIIQL